MLPAAKCNPHQNCIYQLLNALACYNNELQCNNIELQNLLKPEAKKDDCQCSAERNLDCASDEHSSEHQKDTEEVDNARECYQKPIEQIRKAHQTILDEAKNCLRHLRIEKLQFKLFQERTVEHLKKVAIQSDEQTIKETCEKEINELSLEFDKFMSYIENCENTLEPFLKMLEDRKEEGLTKNSLQEFSWMPQGKSMRDIDPIVENIKSSMGSVLTKLFAALHIQQPADSNSFAAAYLMNSLRNEVEVQQKLKAFCSNNMKNNLL